jgi:hypothetical protein
MRCTIAPAVLIGSVAWLSRPMTTTSHPEQTKSLNGSGQMKRIPCAGEIDFCTAKLSQSKNNEA